MPPIACSSWSFFLPSHQVLRLFPPAYALLLSWLCNLDLPPYVLYREFLCKPSCIVDRRLQNNLRYSSKWDCLGTLQVATYIPPYQYFLELFFKSYDLRHNGIADSANNRIIAASSKTQTLLPECRHMHRLLPRLRSPPKRIIQRHPINYTHSQQPLRISSAPFDTEKLRIRST